MGNDLREIYSQISRKYLVEEQNGILTGTKTGNTVIVEGVRERTKVSQNSVDSLIDSVTESVHKFYPSASKLEITVKILEATNPSEKVIE